MNRDKQLPKRLSGGLFIIPCRSICGCLAGLSLEAVQAFALVGPSGIPM